MEIIRRLRHASIFKNLWNLPNGGGSHSTRIQLGRLSIRTFRATCQDGKIIDVLYEYDLERNIKHRVLIKSITLFTLFGGTTFIKPKCWRGFVSLSDLEQLVKMCAPLVLCGGRIHSPCLGWHEDPEFEGEVCPSDHFHHYCPGHVNLWLTIYLWKTIILRECDYGVLLQFSNRQVANYMTTEERHTPEYFLRATRRRECFFKL